MSKEILLFQFCNTNVLLCHSTAAQPKNVSCVILLSDAHSIRFLSSFSSASLLLFVVWRVPRILVFTVLSIGFPYFTKFVQLLCSLSGWLHLNCSSIGTGFNGAENNCRIACNLGILLMNCNCFAIFFSSILVASVYIQYLSITTQVPL